MDDTDLALDVLRAPGSSRQRDRVTLAPGRPAIAAALPYNGLALDRAAGRRADPAWVDALLARQDCRVIPFWRDKCLVAGSAPAPVSLAGEAARLVIGAAQSSALLGLDGGAGVFAADLSPLAQGAAAELAGASAAVDVRRLLPPWTPSRPRRLLMRAACCGGAASSASAVRAAPVPAPRTAAACAVAPARTAARYCFPGWSRR